MSESPPAAYLLCGTPGTGSTLLCRLLAATGVAGLPQSYFREQDEREWARRWGLPTRGDRAVDYHEFVEAARRAGTTPNGVFGARVMWGTQGEIVAKLRHGGTPPTDDLSALQDALGPLRFVYIWRDDVVAQAVSWARAEQTGYWQDDDSPPRHHPVFSAVQIDQLLQTIEEHNRGWRGWFTDFGIRPHVVRYEDLIRDVRGEVSDLLKFLGLDLPKGFDPSPPTRRQADELNAEWVARYRHASVVTPGATQLSRRT